MAPAFLGSVVLVVIGLIVRLKIEETPSFKVMADTNTVAKTPLFDVVRMQPVQLLLGAGSVSMVFALFHTGATFLTSYAGATLLLPRSTVLTGGIIGALVFAVFIAISAIYSDRLGRRNVTMTACALAIPWSLVLFTVVGSGSTFAYFLGVSITFAIAGIGYGPVGAQLPELFRPGIATRAGIATASRASSAVPSPRWSPRPPSRAGARTLSATTWPATRSSAFSACWRCRRPVRSRWTTRGAQLRQS